MGHGMLLDERSLAGGDLAGEKGVREALVTRAIRVGESGASNASEDPLGESVCCEGDQKSWP